ncbi:MAG: 50S ribosomal protein L7 [Clostridiales bacterium]|nr:50S ribosomal protein L7 [Clostridiales bacterium]
MDKTLGYLGLAKKAGALQSGETNSGAAVRAGKARVLLLASDASENARRRAEGFIYSTQTPLVTLPYSKLELSSAVGSSDCAMAAITDIGLAAVFMSSLCDRSDSYKDTAELLMLKNEKAKTRKREALAHDRNKKMGRTVKDAKSGKRRKNK